MDFSTDTALLNAAACKLVIEDLSDEDGDETSFANECCGDEEVLLLLLLSL